MWLQSDIHVLEKTNKSSVWLWCHSAMVLHSYHPNQAQVTFRKYYHPLAVSAKGSSCLWLWRQTLSKPTCRTQTGAAGAPRGIMLLAHANTLLPLCNWFKTSWICERSCPQQSLCNSTLPPHAKLLKGRKNYTLGMTKKIKQHKHWGQFVQCRIVHGTCLEACLACVLGMQARCRNMKN